MNKEGEKIEVGDNEKGVFKHFAKEFWINIEDILLIKNWN